MENKNAMSEIINQAKLIEENNFNNMEYTNSINLLLASNDLARSKDKELSEKVDKLNRQIEDINSLTQDLLDDLSKRHNWHKGRYAGTAYLFINIALDGVTIIERLI